MAFKDVVLYAAHQTRPRRVEIDREMNAVEFPSFAVLFIHDVFLVAADCGWVAGVGEVFQFCFCGICEVEAPVGQSRCGANQRRWYVNIEANMGSYRAEPRDCSGRS